LDLGILNSDFFVVWDFDLFMVQYQYVLLPMSWFFSSNRFRWPPSRRQAESEHFIKFRYLDTQSNAAGQHYTHWHVTSKSCITCITCITSKLSRTQLFPSLSQVDLAFTAWEMELRGYFSFEGLSQVMVWAGGFGARWFGSLGTP